MKFPWLFCWKLNLLLIKYSFVPIQSEEILLPRSPESAVKPVMLEYCVKVTIIKATSLHYLLRYFLLDYIIALKYIKNITVVIHVLCILTNLKYLIFILLLFKIKVGDNSTVLLQFRIIVYHRSKEKLDS